MGHGAASEWGEDRSAGFKKRVGFIFFICYAVVYFGFIVINTLSPKTMGVEVIFGLNLAVIYGFGLIVLAIVSGLFYNMICGRKERRMNDGGDS